MPPVSQHHPVSFAEKNRRRREGRAEAKSVRHLKAARTARRERLHGAFGSAPSHRFNWMAYGTAATFRVEKDNEPDDLMFIIDRNRDYNVTGPTKTWFGYCGACGKRVRAKWLVGFLHSCEPV